MKDFIIMLAFAGGLTYLLIPIIIAIKGAIQSTKTVKIRNHRSGKNIKSSLTAIVFLLVSISTGIVSFEVGLNPYLRVINILATITFAILAISMIISLIYLNWNIRKQENKALDFETVDDNYFTYSNAESFTEDYFCIEKRNEDSNNEKAHEKTSLSQDITFKKLVTLCYKSNEVKEHFYLYKSLNLEKLKKATQDVNLLNTEEAKSFISLKKG
ncbi:hypothetical protein [Staphylococcus equorum]|uniref:Uncharacterized protein n=1 Tax=Staphylococcus equorum TaxID=246432 RepID=A0AAP7IF45_9STAP|nr:hypothetical protein [Staphylococcus equorum]OEK58932.1 hypothetical protein ASS94_00995 [Staphylococcus equorum]